MQSYLEYLPTSGLRPKTIAETTTTAKRFDAWLAGRAITLPVLAEWRDALARRRLRPNVKNLEQARIAAAVRWMMGRGLLDLPAERVSAIFARFPVDREAPRVLSRPEIQRLAMACTARETGRAVLALLVTGARREEVLSLRPENLTGQGIEITAARSKNRTGRVIPWFLIGEGKKLFDPLPFRFLRDEWDAIRDEAGVDVPLKALRSTWVSYASYAGVLPMIAIAKTAGHTLAVCEANYIGAPMYGIGGESAPEWMGLVL